MSYDLGSQVGSDGSLFLARTAVVGGFSVVYLDISGGTITVPPTGANSSRPAGGQVWPRGL
jgi:hypothetical protein